MSEVETPSRSQRATRNTASRGRRALATRALGGVLLLGFTFAVAVSARAFMYQWSTGHVPPKPVDRRTADVGIDGLRDVAFASGPGVSIRGWLSPARNGAAVILAHGSDANRTQLVPEARALAAAGFGVLAFDWPGHGESGGQLEWGRAERRALQAAIDYLASQDDVQTDRIGAFGFSIGGFYLAQVAAHDARLRAVALAAVPHDLDALRRWEHRRWGALSEESGLLAAHLMYGASDDFVPVRLVARIAPRPLLLIEGALDESVPRFMTEELFRAAGQPKDRFIVPNAGHGDFDKVAPQAYAERLRVFFERALLTDSWKAAPTAAQAPVGRSAHEFRHPLPEPR